MILGTTTYRQFQIFTDCGNTFLYIQHVLPISVKCANMCCQIHFNVATCVAKYISLWQRVLPNTFQCDSMKFLCIQHVLPILPISVNFLYTEAKSLESQYISCAFYGPLSCEHACCRQMPWWYFTFARTINMECESFGMERIVWEGKDCVRDFSRYDCTNIWW